MRLLPVISWPDLSYSLPLPTAKSERPYHPYGHSFLSPGTYHDRADLSAFFPGEIFSSSHWPHVPVTIRFHIQLLFLHDIKTQKSGCNPASGNHPASYDNFPSSFRADSIPLLYSPALQYAALLLIHEIRSIPDVLQNVPAKIWTLRIFLQSRLSYLCRSLSCSHIDTGIYTAHFHSSPNNTDSSAHLSSSQSSPVSDLLLLFTNSRYRTDRISNNI